MVAGLAAYNPISCPDEAGINPGKGGWFVSAPTRLKYIVYNNLCQFYFREKNVITYGHFINIKILIFKEKNEKKWASTLSLHAHP